MCLYEGAASRAFAFRREPRGILPTILNTLLTRRKAAKREMANADGLARAIANGKQLALKLVANSIYGFTGAAELGMLPQPQIAAAVTYMGRKLTLGTKALCERDGAASDPLCVETVAQPEKSTEQARSDSRTRGLRHMASLRWGWLQ